MFLDFREAHQDLAEKVADEASARAAVVGSGRVSRTKKIDIEVRAALAAKAYIRHRFTSYEDDLVDQAVRDHVAPLGTCRWLTKITPRARGVDPTHS